jgi:hypothetical protein
MALSPEEKAARKQARLEAHGPVVGQIASADKPDVFYDVRFDGKVYWCPCVGFAIRKHCRHADYCRKGGFSVPMAVPGNTSIRYGRFNTLDEALGEVHALLRGGGYGDYLCRAVADARTQLRTTPVTTDWKQLTGDAAPVFAGRRIVLED